MIDYVTVMITDACNLKCEHCYKTQKNTKCDIERAKQFIIEEKPRIVILFGGEPLLESNLDIVEQLIEFCSSHGISCFMSSNLTFELTDRRMNIIKSLGDLNTSFNIKRWHDPKLFELWLKNCIKLKSVRDIACACTLDKDLISEAPKRVYDFLTPLPFLQFCFEPYVGLNKPKNEDIDNWLCEYYQLSKNDQVINFFFASIFAKFKGKVISARFDPMCWKKSKVLHTDGHITCCPISQVDITKGREVLETKYTLSQKCLDCRWKPYCDGVCPLLKDDPDYCHGYPKLYELMYNDFQNGFCR